MLAHSCNHAFLGHKHIAEQKKNYFTPTQLLTRFKFSGHQKWGVTMSPREQGPRIKHWKPSVEEESQITKKTRRPVQIKVEPAPNWDPSKTNQRQNWLSSVWDRSRSLFEPGLEFETGWNPSFNRGLRFRLWSNWTWNRSIPNQVLFCSFEL
jgi:hypothetical protein